MSKSVETNELLNLYFCILLSPHGSCLAPPAYFFPPNRSQEAPGLRCAPSRLHAAVATNVARMKRSGIRGFGVTDYGSYHASYSLCESFRQTDAIHGCRSRGSPAGR